MKTCKTILVVDDDTFLREAVCEFIQFIRPTWRTVVATNGQKGIEVAEAEQPDLIMTDLCMPVMNGYDMVLALQKKPQTRAIPLILSTGEDSNCLQVRQLKMICQAVIYKPFLFDELENVLDQAMPTYINVASNLPAYAATRHVRLPGIGRHGKYYPMVLTTGYTYSVEVSNLKV